MGLFVSLRGRGPALLLDVLFVVLCAGLTEFDEAFGRLCEFLAVFSFSLLDLTLIVATKLSWPFSNLMLLSMRKSIYFYFSSSGSSEKFIVFSLVLMAAVVSVYYVLFNVFATR